MSYHRMSSIPTALVKTKIVRLYFLKGQRLRRRRAVLREIDEWKKDSYISIEKKANAIEELKQKVAAEERKIQIYSEIIFHFRSLLEDAAMKDVVEKDKSKKYFLTVVRCSELKNEEDDFPVQLF